MNDSDKRRKARKGSHEVNRDQMLAYLDAAAATPPPFRGEWTIEGHMFWMGTSTRVRELLASTEALPKTSAGLS